MDQTYFDLGIELARYGEFIEAILHGMFTKGFGGYSHSSAGVGGAGNLFSDKCNYFVIYAVINANRKCDVTIDLANSFNSDVQVV